MSLLGKIIKLRNRKIIRPLIYDESIQSAYGTTSICGGNLRGKTAVVTGATSGIGYAIAQRLLNENCNVIITGRSESKLKSTIEKLHNPQVCKIQYRVIDQLNPQMISTGIEDIFSGFCVDIWINCAGVLKLTDRERRFRDVDAATYFEVVNTNLDSIMLTTELVASRMINQCGDSVILNVSSLCGLTNGFGYTPYGISKNGLIEYTKNIAIKFRENVSIISVAPGSVATRMGNLGIGNNIAGTNSFTRHVGMPEEIASEIVFLVSTVAKYIKGKTVLASAGEIL